MKFLICGTVVSTEYETKIEHLSIAANRFLMNFCEVLKERGRVDIVSYLGIPVSEGVMRALKSEEKSKGNIFYTYGFKHKIKGVISNFRMFKQKLEDADYAVGYNTVYAWLLLPMLAKRMHKKSVLILADYSSADICRDILGKLYAEMQLLSIQKYEYVVGLSDNVKMYLKPSQRFICIEGGIDQQFYDFYAKEKECTDNVVIFQYAGILESITGIDQLVKAFRRTSDSNYRLRISGRGSLTCWIEKMTEVDSRIQYLGCPEYDKYMEILYNADILVNPRNMELMENKNNFPSKIMEYLATGKRIISTRFPGWERYKEVIIFCGSDVISLEEQLIEQAECVMRKEKNIFETRRKFAEQFIWKNQIEKFINFINEV